jgi:hypothetical protein
MKDNGNYGAVEGTNYCMDSMNARNVKEMNDKMKLPQYERSR